MLYGEVKWFDNTKRFGFIIADGKEYFAHADAILGDEDKLLQGQKVEFRVQANAKGPQARDITVMEVNGNV